MDESIARFRDTFAADPDDRTAFDALEEHHFVSGEWQELKAMYERRIAAPSLADDPSRRARLSFRLAQVIDERLLDPDTALPIYWQAVEHDSSFRPALRQIRAIHARRSQWDMVLQVAELEESLVTKPKDRAEFLVELGTVWEHELGDPEQALTCFDEALALIPHEQQGLMGRALSLTALERPSEAALSWEKLIELLRGPERAPAQVQLARLLAGPLDDSERAAEFYRRALADDPTHSEALDALVAHATAQEQWPALVELYERRFDLTAGARARAAVALEASRTHLHHLDNPSAARVWLDRAAELCPEDIEVNHGLAELERREGNSEALLAALEGLIEVAGDAAPAGTLIEAAEIHGEAGRGDRAVTLLRDALERAPHDPRVLEALSSGLEAQGRSSELADILERRAELVEDPEDKTSLLVELGRVYEEDLGDDDARRDALTRAFEARPDAPAVAATLAAIHRRNEDWEALRELLERAAADGPSDERCKLQCELGELMLEHFDDATAAGRSLELALTHDPESPRAFAGLQKLASRSADDDALLALWEREASVSSDPARVAELLDQIIRVLEARGQHEQALERLEQLLAARPDDRTLLESAARLQQALGRDDALATTLGLIDPLLSGSEQAENRMRLAEVHTRAGRDFDAASCFEGVLEDDPRNLDALRALRVHYLGQRDWDPLAAVCRRLADLESGATRLRRLDELAGLLEAQIGDRNGAIEVLNRLWELSRSEGEAMPADGLERLGNLLQHEARIEEFAEVLAERAATVPEADPLRLDLDLERALVLLDPLERLDEAAELFRKVLVGRPHELQAEDGLERAVRGGGNPESLVALLAERSDDEQDASLRVPMQIERAALLDETLGRSAEAITIYTELADESHDPEVASDAEARLQSILERSADWVGLRARLEAQLARGDGSESSLREQLAELCRDRLGEMDACAEHLETLAALEPERADVWCTLSELYLNEAGKSDDLLRVTMAELAASPDGHRKPVLLGRAARACADRDAREDASRYYAQLLELEPSNAEASEYLVGRSQQADDQTRVLELLEARLAAGSEVAVDASVERERRLTLLVRIAAQLARQLGNHPRAIATLETALGENGPVAAIAEPLLALYEQQELVDQRVELSRRAVETADGSELRARWQECLGRALRERGTDADLSEALDAYRGVLSVREDDREASLQLCDLHRRLDQPAELATLLEAQLESGREAVPQRTRLELATLFWKQLDRPEDALSQLRKILHGEPGEETAFNAALEIAGGLERPEEQLELIDARLAGPVLSDERATLLEMRGDLLSGPLDRLEDAAVSYREAGTIAHDREGVLNSWRRVLERLERWTDLLEALELSARSAPPEQRVQLLAKAADVASLHIGPDASLPWLMRLRVARPEQASLCSRIADLHRDAGRPLPLLRAIDDELTLSPAPEREATLQRERAGLLSGACEAPGLAVEALERVARLCPADTEVRAQLEELYERLDRPEAQLTMLLSRIERDASQPVDRIALHRRAAELCSERLGKKEEAAAHWLRAVSACSAESAPAAVELAELIRGLSRCLRDCSRLDAWARAAEAELVALSKQADFEERRVALHLELAGAYRDELGRPEDALEHLRALVDGAFEQADRGDAETRLLDALRAAGAHLELERRLTTRLEAGESDALLWLELARLRDERLQALPAAAQAYRALLASQPSGEVQLAGIRGLRFTCERLADWSEVANMLEAELEHETGGTPAQRAAILRRLGEICWHRLGRRDDAAKAYTRALETQPEDLGALHSLEQLHEERGEWLLALDLYDRETRQLGDSDSARVLEVALHVAELASRRANDPSRALRAFECAAEHATSASELGRLSSTHTRQWAELYLETDQPQRFTEVFAQWCDDESSDCSASDHLRLAEVHADIAHPELALARAIRAGTCDPSDARAFDLAAKLQEAAGDCDAAATSLERAADCLSGGAAAERLCRAGSLCNTAERRAQLLRRAVTEDAASVEAQALLGEAEWSLSRFAEAEAAAGHAFELSGGAPSEDLPDEAFVATAMIGGGAAVRSEHPERAAEFYATALRIQPDLAEALDAQSELLFGLGDLAGARKTLETRLAQQAPNPKRAEQLMMAGLANGQLNAPEAALEQLTGALALDPTLEDAHRAIVKIHQGEGRNDLAVAALAHWCQSVPDSASPQFLHAAELELRAGETGAAEQLLRSSTEADRSNTQAQVMLAELLWNSGRATDALEVASDALEHCDDREDRAKLEALRGRVLEQQGNARGAAEAFGVAAACDPRRVDAALSQARLLRAAGDWLPAATALGAFVAGYPDADDPAIASLFFEWGRLLAGPLENTEEAIEHYERALALDPDHTAAREQLANLLTHIPARWSDAARLHGETLADQPIHTGGLRGLMRIARGSGSDSAQRFGLALLRALGTASPEERNAAPASLPQELAATPRLAGDPAEQARLLVLQCAPELNAALSSSPQPLDEHSFDPNDPVASYLHCVRRAEEDLLGAGLAAYPASELGDAVRTLLDLCMGREGGTPSSGFRAKLETSLGRWARRKLRRIIETMEADAIRALDFEAWRAELHTLATVVAVDRSGGELRSALVALCRENAGAKMVDPTENADITTAIAASPQASALLGHVVTAWAAEVARSSG